MLDQLASTCAGLALGAVALLGKRWWKDRKRRSFYRDYWSAAARCAAEKSGIEVDGG